MIDESRLLELIHRYLDGDSSAALLEELRQALETDPEARRTYFEEMRLHAALVHKAATAGRAVEQAADARRFIRLRPILALAASILVVAGIVYLFTRTGGPATAVVTQVSGAVHGGQTGLRPGDVLAPDQPVTVGPRAKVVFAYRGEDTRVEVGESSVFSVSTSAKASPFAEATADKTADRQGSRRGGKQTYLRQGRLMATVAKQRAGRSMEFVTPHGKATVLGTRLRLTVGSDMARVDMDEGRCRLTRAVDGATADLATGQLAVLGKDVVLKPYSAGTEYVDGPVVYSDRFDRGLAGWDITLKEPGKADIRRPYSPDDAELAKYVILTTTGGVGTVGLDPRQSDRTVDMSLREPGIPMGNVVMEYDVLYEKDYGHPDRDYARFSASTSDKDLIRSANQMPARFPLGQWTPHRMEHTIRVDSSGKAERETSYTVRGILLQRGVTPLPDDHWKQPDSRIECRVGTTGIKTRVSNFSIRRLVFLKPEANPADGAILFQDDFESGTLAKWHAARGDWSVVPRADGQGKCLKLAWKAGASPMPRIITSYVPRDADFELSYDFIAPTTQYSLGPWIMAPDADANVPANLSDAESKRLPISVTGGEWSRQVFTFRNRQIGLRSYQGGRLLYERRGELAGPYVGIGLAGMAIAEDRDLYIDNVTIRKLPGISSLGNRTTDGLLAAYLFNETEGRLVHDSSGVGAPLDLSIERPEFTRWLQPGLAVKESGPALTSDVTRKIGDAFRETDAVTFEHWASPDPERWTNHAQTAFLALKWDEATWNYSHNYPEPPQIGNPPQAVVLCIVKQQSEIVLKIYRNGKFSCSTRLDPRLGGALASRPLRIQMPGVVTPAGDGVPWVGTYRFLAIYGRELTPAEVEENFRAGVPKLPPYR